MIENTLPKIFRVLKKLEFPEALIESKANLKYLSWSSVLDIVMTKCPENWEIDYGVVMDKNTCQNYTNCQNLGFYVTTFIDINGVRKECQLPVTDFKNKSMTANCTTMDINTAIMRCQVKNFALFGFGLDLYKGLDLPKVLTEKEELEIVFQNLLIALKDKNRFTKAEKHYLAIKLKLDQNQIDQIENEIQNQLK